MHRMDTQRLIETNHEECHGEIHWGHTHKPAHEDRHPHYNRVTQPRFHVLVLIPWKPEMVTSYPSKVRGLCII